MPSNFRIRGVWFILVSMCTIATGCQQAAEKPTQTSASEFAPTIQIQVDRSEEYEGSNAAAFNTALTDPDVQAGFAMLQAEGYAWVDTNSVLLIRETWQSYGPSGAAYRRPRLDDELLVADTVVWLAFETPTVDFSNHTAIVFGIIEGTKFTALTEANVGVVPPTRIREGKIIDGNYKPLDPGLQGFWGCWAAGSAAGATGCMLTNCCWGKCAGAGAAASLVGCGVAALLGA